MKNHNDYEQLILAKLAAEKVDFNNKEAVYKCLQETVAPDFCWQIYLDMINQ